MNDSSSGSDKEVYFDDLYISTSPNRAYKKGINCGGDVYIASDLKKYEADQRYSSTNHFGYENGNTEMTSDPINNTLDQYLYQTGRWGEFNYFFDVPNGIYKVNFKFAETWDGTVTDGEQKRVFNVYLQNKLVKDRFLFTEIADDSAVDYDFITEVKNNQLVINTKTLNNQPKISALYVEQVSWETQAPAAVTGLVAVARSNLVFLDWKSCTNSDLKRYKIYIEGRTR